jgi:hypothetical protein
MTDFELAMHIADDLSGPCSFERYLGFNLPPGKHTTLGNSALGSRAFDRLLRRERSENVKILQDLRKTCQVGYQAHLLN